MDSGLGRPISTFSQFVEPLFLLNTLDIAMSQGPFERVRRLYGRAEGITRDIDDLDAAACSYMATISNILERLPASFFSRFICVAVN